MLDHSRSPRLVVAILATFAFLLLPGATGSTSAQFGEAAGFTEIMMPYYLRRDLSLFEVSLELDDAQAAILESLYMDYEDSQEASKVAMMERFSTMKEELDAKSETEVMELVFRPFEEKAEDWEKLNDAFLYNVQAILSSQQVDAWPRFERELRRQKELPKGKYAGENIDVIEIASLLELDREARDEIDIVLEDYGIALDAMLARRTDVLRGSRLPMMRSIQENDMNASLKLYEEQIAARIGVRDVNDEYTAIVWESLPDDARDFFLNEIYVRAYPRVYGRKTSAHRLIMGASEINDLDPDTLAAIIELQDNYQTELESLNQRLVELIRRHEPDDDRFRARAYVMRAQGETPTRPDDPTREAFRERQRLDNQYAETLKSMLTPEQFAGLPGAGRFADRAGPDDDVHLSPTGDPAGPDLNLGPASSGSAGGKSRGGGRK